MVQARPQHGLSPNVTRCLCGDTENNPRQIRLSSNIRPLRAFIVRNCGLLHTMSASLPFRDINVHASHSYYAFSSPSSPESPTLVVDRPSGDLRLHDGKLTGGHRVSSISGILGVIKLKFGEGGANHCAWAWQKQEPKGTD